MGRKKTKVQPDIKRGVVSIFFVLLGVLILLSFFNAAGTFGIWLDETILNSLFGTLKYFVPFCAFFLSWAIAKGDEVQAEPKILIGIILLVISITSFFNIGFDLDIMFSEATSGKGSGLIGMFAWVIKNFLGMAGGIVTLIALGLIGILLVFNNPGMHGLIIHKTLVGTLSAFGKMIRSAASALFVSNNKRDSYEYEDEDDDEEDEYEDLMEEPTFTTNELSKDIDEEDDEEYEDDEENEDEDDDEYIEEDDLKKVHTIPNEPSSDVGYLHNVVIKPVPPIGLLSAKKGKPTSGDIHANLKIIQDTFADFNIDMEMGEARVGPTVTQFTLKPPRGVKLSRITALSNNLALNLAAHPIRIEAPIPGKSLVGIEVPNEKTAMVSLREILESKEFKKREHNMMVALGKDVAGKVWLADLPKMPHLLVAGATGSGKTVCVNTMILSLLYQNTAETLRFIMVDPKRVELTLYDGIPHLITPVITNPAKTVNALKWTVAEMERRFEVLQKAGNRDITSYNKSHPGKKMPHIVFVIDELADLMATAANDVESGIIRLAQMARAVGIHLIVATQRPSVDVITGIMKANIPGRIAFSVASVTDSRTILDSPGADKLIGRGDMLLSTAALSKPVRIQGCFASEKELKAVISNLKKGVEAHYDESVIEREKGGTMNMFGGPADDQDPLFGDAKATILMAGKASASFLQRKLRVGYARAARILDELESAGIIGPSNGSKPRDILIKADNTSMGMGGENNVFDDLSQKEEKEEDEEKESIEAKGEDAFEFAIEESSEEKKKIIEDDEYLDLIEEETKDDEDVF